MDFFIIGDHDTVLGFSLSGIEGRVAKDDRDAHAALREVMESGRVGILLITERYAQALRNELDNIMLKSRYPLVLEIPDMSGPLEDKITISDLVKTAIGVKI